MLTLVSRPPEAPTAMADRLAGLRRAQAQWREVPLARRVDVARKMRRLIAATEGSLVEAVTLPQRRSHAETVSAELLPLADACRFAARAAPALLRTRKLGSEGRPFWLSGSQARIVRQPWGVVLIISTPNYPLLLPGVQALQAIVAGNAVAIKPGRGARPAAEALQRLFIEAGAPAELILVLDDSIDAASTAIATGVDRVVLTGSAPTGRAVLQQLAPSLTPAVMELSGCDAVFVGSDADIELAARALRFGLTLNGGFTCLAPRRVFVAAQKAAELETRLAALLENSPEIPVDASTARQVQTVAHGALENGARLCAGHLPGRGVMTPLVLAGVRPGMRVALGDLSAPVLSIMRVKDDAQALDWSRQCGYQLGATIFGAPAAAQKLADQIDAGVVVINDMIVPTADPRVPFGGRGESGFGVTRGAEGLLEMTQPQTVILRRGRFRPHFDPPGPDDRRLLSSFLQVSHGGTLGIRLRAGLEMVRLILRRGR